mmetsp:Transcript_54592/g.108383  ORF Transcript_54592/g.108383 Transcript_54592/m.108383 type:complete len:415 (+) Transcript_54592:538-1782(+)
MAERVVLTTALRAWRNSSSAFFTSARARSSGGMVARALASGCQLVALPGTTPRRASRIVMTRRADAMRAVAPLEGRGMASHSATACWRGPTSIASCDHAPSSAPCLEPPFCIAARSVLIVASRFSPSSSNADLTSVIPWCSVGTASRAAVRADHEAALLQSHLMRACLTVSTILASTASDLPASDIAGKPVSCLSASSSEAIAMPEWSHSADAGPLSPAAAPAAARTECPQDSASFTSVSVRVRISSSSARAASSSLVDGSPGTWSGVGSWAPSSNAAKRGAHDDASSQSHPSRASRTRTATLAHLTSACPLAEGLGKAAHSAAAAESSVVSIGPWSHPPAAFLTDLPVPSCVHTASSQCMRTASNSAFASVRSSHSTSPLAAPCRAFATPAHEAADSQLALSVSSRRLMASIA